MGKLKILAHGKTPQAKNEARGKLFETMMTRVLLHYGYTIDRILKIDASEMEIEIEGEHKATGDSLYADCKFYETAVSERELQAFYGKYMTRWHKDKQCHGLFVALPGIDSCAREFYREHIEKNPVVTTILYEEKEVLEAFSGTIGFGDSSTFAARIPRNMGKPGDYFLLYTEKGVFRVCFIISSGKEIPDKITLFDGRGAPLSDPSILGYLTKLYPELGDFENISIVDTSVLQPGLFLETDEIVEVKGSPECFEYRYPAAPGEFIGRKPLLKALDLFATKLINKGTAHRGILFEGLSGWGKSSVVLASVDRLQKSGHFAVAIDSRTATSSKFITHAIRYTIEKFEDFAGMVTEDKRPESITDFDGAVKSILEIGEILESKGKLLIIFFDQFENIFFLPDLLKRIKDFFLKICEKQTHVILGFSWAENLIPSAAVFAGELLDAVSYSSKKMVLESFPRKEIYTLLKKLGNELREPLSGDLQSFLIEFSRGYPWLLKILCFHVKVARQSGIPQSDISKNLLSIKELFQHELQKLSDKERISLIQIAKVAPIDLAELQEKIDPQVVKSLIKQRLIIKIGNTVDIFGHIFRDYLNTGLLPFHNNYLPHTRPGYMLNAMKILHAAGGYLDIHQFKEQTDLSGKQFYAVAKDMDLLGVVKFTKGMASLQIKPPAPHYDISASLRKHLQKRLRCNRLVDKLLKSLADKNILTTDEVSSLLKISFPYKAVAGKAGLQHTRILAEWMDTANLALLDKKNRSLISFDPSTEIREHRFLLPKIRGARVPRIHYAPVENVAIRLVQSLHGGGSVDWTDLRKNTIFRALATLEDLGFIRRRAPLIKVLPKGKEFAANPDKRPSLFAEGALQMPAFSIFIEILKSHQSKGNTLLGLGLELKEKLGANWKENTAEATAKIMLDWARHSKLAPGVFSEIRKGPIKGWKKREDRQLALF